MTNELQQDFTMRITQANRAELIVVLYDVTLQYLHDAQICNKEEYSENIKMANQCLTEMIFNLHPEYELAEKLKELYLFMKQTLRLAIKENEQTGVTADATIQSVIEQLQTLRDAYETAARDDHTPALMQHAQKVTAGLTYGKTDLTQSISGEDSNRGFRI